MSDTSQPRPSDRFIPWYIVMFFVAQTVLFTWFVYVAETTYTGVVTEEPYEKGLHYNQIIEKEQKQESLGFSSIIESKDNSIFFTLKDKEGKAVSKAKVRLWLFRPVHDGGDMSLDMTEEAAGRYHAVLQLPEKGLWEIRIRAETDKGPYQSSKRIVFE